MDLWGQFNHKRQYYKCIQHETYIRRVNVTPYSTNMNKITYRQAAIDISMPGEFKKWN